MDREFRFRCWSELRKEMSNPFDLFDISWDDDRDGHFINNDFNDYFGVGYLKEVFMQFTGIKDTEGKEIYEGDILTNGTNNYECIFWKGSFVAKLIGSKKKNQGYLALEILRIIGNKYQGTSHKQRSAK